VAAGEQEQEHEPDRSDTGEAMVPTSLSLTTQAREALESIAEMNNRTFAAEIRLALRNHLLRYGMGDALPDIRERSRTRKREL
jgi:hypothetical protein